MATASAQAGELFVHTCVLRTCEDAFKFHNSHFWALFCDIVVVSYLKGWLLGLPLVVRSRLWFEHEAAGKISGSGCTRHIHEGRLYVEGRI
jgi:hypothetical protein